MLDKENQANCTSEKTWDKAIQESSIEGANMYVFTNK